MEQVVGFEQLEIGQRVVVKGRLANGTFTALEISVQYPEVCSSLTGLVEGIEYETRTLRVLGRDFSLSKNVELKDFEHDLLDVGDLNAEGLAKVEGRYTHEKGLVPEMIKIKPKRDFNLDKLKGDIEAIDSETGTLQVLGFNVLVDARTAIEDLA
ncbi:DUF5666 domain-containing protein [bacterium]|nr:DUF5666 domain-containing protein [bacterium]